MGFIDRVTTFIANKTIQAAQLNQELDQILALLNGGLQNNNVALNAGIRQDEGKVVLDYDAIRTELWTGATNWLDGGALIDGSVDIEKLEDPAADTLSPTGIFTPTVHGSYPMTIPANEFQHYMIVIWSCQLDVPAGGSNKESDTTVALFADSNQLTTTPNGTHRTEDTLERDGGGEEIHVPITAIAMLSMSSSNDYTSNPATLDRAVSHAMDIQIVGTPEQAGTTISKKMMAVFGR